jgi:hypothetical protein
MKYKRMKNKRNLFYVFLYIFMLALSLMIQPSADDWYFLRYFSSASNWHVSSYHWLYNNILLPRNFWRPWEDFILFGETYFPYVYPYLNHFLIVTLHFASGIFLLKIMKQLKIKEKLAFYATLFYLMATTAMGGAFSVDSITQVLATFFGILSVYFYLSSFRFKYVLWVLIGFMACFSKESGFVFFIIAPLIKLLTEVRANKLQTIQQIDRRAFFKAVIIASIPMFLYLGVYFSLTTAQRNYTKALKKDNVVSQIDQKRNADYSKTTFELMTSSQKGYKLSSTIFVKNVFILYIASVFPIDTSSIYYSNWWLLILSFALSFTALFILVRLLRHKKIQWLQLAVCVLLVLIASSPSLITRAGEISPHQVNLFMALLFTVLFETYKLRKWDNVFLLLFVVSTLITDSHKYVMAFNGGNVGRAMAKEVKRKSIANPDKVLWIGPDEYLSDRAGAAFNKSPYNSFFQGNAVIREYGYIYPKVLNKIILPSPVYDRNIIDSIIQSKIGEYDCIWITHQNIVEVINCHK